MVSKSQKGLQLQRPRDWLVTIWQPLVATEKMSIYFTLQLVQLEQCKTLICLQTATIQH